VYGFLEEIASGILNRLFYRFPQITDLIAEAITRVLQQEKEKARQIVESIIEAEQTYLFTNDVDYLTNRTNLIPSGEPNKVISDSKNVFVMELRNRIDTFFKIVVRNMRDSIPKKPLDIS